MRGSRSVLTVTDAAHLANGRFVIATHLGARSRRASGFVTVAAYLHVTLSVGRKMPNAGPRTRRSAVQLTQGGCRRNFTPRDSDMQEARVERSLLPHGRFLAASSRGLCSLLGRP